MEIYIWRVGGFFWGLIGLYQTFMSSIADKCREKRHHPEWANVRTWLFFFVLFSCFFFLLLGHVDRFYRLSWGVLVK